MDEDLLGDPLLRDAAVVHSARQRIDEAIAELSARPFDEAAAAGMRRALRANAPAREALRRLGISTGPGPGAPVGLQLVASDQGAPGRLSATGPQLRRQLRPDWPELAGGAA